MRFNTQENELLIYGGTEMTMDYENTILDLKKTIQKFIMKLWSRMLKGDD